MLSEALCFSTHLKDHHCPGPYSKVEAPSELLKYLLKAASPIIKVNKSPEKLMQLNII